MTSPYNNQDRNSMIRSAKTPMDKAKLIVALYPTDRTGRRFANGTPKKIKKMFRRLKVERATGMIPL